MSRHSGRYGRTIPLSASRAEFEDFEARVEARELDRWLAEHEPDDQDDA